MKVNIFIRIVVTVFVLQFVSCSEKSESELKYELTEHGLPYFYHVKSDTGQLASKGDFLVLNLKYCIIRNDSLLFNSDEMPGKYRITLKNSTLKNGKSIEDALSMMRVGDSMSFKINAMDFYMKTMKRRQPAFIKIDDSLRFDIRLKDIQNKEEVFADLEALWEKNKQEEQQLLDDFIAKNFPNAEENPNGLYVIETEKGKGEKIRGGDYVSIHYEATFINGQKFDSSYDRDEVFSFDLGKQQVIPGLEEGVSRLSVGSKATIVIPSHLAYGAKGYGKTIQPYTSLVFKVEVLMTNHFQK